MESLNDMRTKRVLRYFCDFCSKGMFQKPAMLRHEVICLQNPGRKCWACEQFGLSAAPLSELIDIAKKVPHQNKPEDLADLRAASGGCPACILSAILQSQPKSIESEDRKYFIFDYKSEIKIVSDNFYTDQVSPYS